MMKIKENEIKRLEIDLKVNFQKIREYEREILKLKVSEMEYKQLKGKMDEGIRKLVELRNELKEKDQNMKKFKGEYEQQISEMDQEFFRERDDME